MALLKSHSQYGEDETFVSLLPATGRLLEIGAYHPTTFSNSRALIEKGWQAVLIEPSPYAMQSLLEEYGHAEPLVTLIQAAVTVEAVALVPLAVTRDAVSTSSDTVYEAWREQAAYVGNINCASITIPEITNQFGGFDFVSIDAEGYSVEIAIAYIQTYKQRPQVLICEHDGRIVELSQVMHACGYKTVLTNGTNLVFAR